ncbi:MAG: hypothetical protein SF162_12540 [bacterium]|nr:hypothetical protein [bacterium]
MNAVRLPQFRLGIIGGCLSHQDGMPLSTLYHRQLAARLKNEYGIKLTVHITRAFDRPYAERLETLLAEHPVDAVLLHMRSAAARKSNLLVRHTVNSEARYYLHPFLFRQHQVGWHQVQQQGFAGHWPLLRRSVQLVTAKQHHEPRPGVKVGRFRVNDLNRVIGHALGLAHWALRDEMALLDDVIAAARARQLPLLLMGPTLAQDSSLLPRMANLLNRHLRIVAEREGLPFVPLNALQDAAGQSLFLPDGTHMSVHGHRYVADQVWPLLAPLAHTIVTRPSPHPQPPHHAH